MRKRRLAEVKLCVQVMPAGAKGLPFQTRSMSKFKSLELIHIVLCVSEVSAKGVPVETITLPSDRKDTCKIRTCLGSKTHR